MNIIVANKQKEDLLKSNFTHSEYKCASGIYKINAIINTVSNTKVDYFVIDETAIEDLTDTASLERLVKAINPEKIYLYLTKEGFDNYILICTLINIGIYNFNYTVKGLNSLIDNPKTLDDVISYRNILSSRNAHKKNNQAEVRPMTEEEMAAKINDYMKNNGIKKKSKINYNNYLFQLFNGFIVLPIITLILSLLYYYFTSYIDKVVEPIPGFSEGLNTIIIGKLITPLFLLAIVLGLLIMSGIDKFFDKIIKERKNVYRKIMLLPVLINFAIFSTGFYILHFISKIFNNYDFFINKYMINGMENVVFGASILIIGDYLIHNLFIKKNTLEFEKVLENNYRWWESIDVAFIILFTILSVAYIVVSTSFTNLPIYSFIDKMYHSESICIISIILSLKTIVFNFINRKKEKNN